MFETGVVQANECYSWWHKRYTFSIFLKMKVCCVLSLELPHRGDSNKYTEHTIIIDNGMFCVLIRIALIQYNKKCYSM